MCVLTGNISVFCSERTMKYYYVKLFETSEIHKKYTTQCFQSLRVTSDIKTGAYRNLSALFCTYFFIIIKLVALHISVNVKNSVYVYIDLLNYSRNVKTSICSLNCCFFLFFLHMMFSYYCGNRRMYILVNLC